MIPRSSMTGCCWAERDDERSGTTPDSRTSARWASAEGAAGRTGGTPSNGTGLRTSRPGGAWIRIGRSRKASVICFGLFVEPARPWRW